MFFYICILFFLIAIFVFKKNKKVSYHLSELTFGVIVIHLFIQQGLDNKFVFIWSVLIFSYLIYSFFTIKVCKECGEINRKTLLVKRCTKCNREL